MLGLVQIEAADAALGESSRSHLAGLRASARRDTQVRAERSRTKAMAKPKKSLPSRSHRCGLPARATELTNKTTTGTLGSRAVCSRVVSATLLPHERRDLLEEPPRCARHAPGRFFLPLLDPLSADQASI